MSGPAPVSSPVATGASVPTEAPCLVDGAPVWTGDRFEREDPTHPSVLAGRLVLADAAVVDQAVAAAHRAGATWDRQGVNERAAALRAAVVGVEAEAETIAHALARELGKPLRDCRAEVGVACAVLRAAADDAPAVLTATAEDDQRGRLSVHRRPFGVVAAIVPWNAPLVLSATKVGPALCAGNTVVLKPSPVAGTAAGLLLAALAGGLPPGVLNVVHGDVATGRALVEHPLVRRVAFTGGLRAGAEIMTMAARRAVPVSLELGGNDAAIVLDDVDLSPATMARAVMATFRTSGQVCMAAKRWYVHRSVIDDFLEAFQAAAQEHLVVGDPLDERVTMGPVSTTGQVDRVQGLVDDVVARGGRLLHVGQLDHELAADGGYFLHPGLVLGAGDDWPITAQEQFGPVAPVLAFDDLDEVVRRANATEFGLGSSVWSQDEDRAVALAARLEAGYTFINTHNLDGLAMRAPFGGIKTSGFGREFGPEALLEYTTTHTVHVPPHTRTATSSG